MFKIKKLISPFISPFTFHPFFTWSSGLRKNEGTEEKDPNNSTMATADKSKGAPAVEGTKAPRVTKFQPCSLNTNIVSLVLYSV